MSITSVMSNKEGSMAWRGWSGMALFRVHFTRIDLCLDPSGRGQIFGLLNDNGFRSDARVRLKLPETHTSGLNATPDNEKEPVANHR
jgi:hypothetical protein